MERDGFCRSVRSKLNCFLPCDTKGQEKKLCVRLPRIPHWLKSYVLMFYVFTIVET